MAPSLPPAACKEWRTKTVTLFNSQQNRLFGDVLGEDGEAGTNGKMTVAAVADTAAVADERGDGVVRVRTFIDCDEGGTANHKGGLILSLKRTTKRPRQSLQYNGTQRPH